MAKLPKWAIRQAGGINKKAWALARRKKRTTRKRAPARRRAPVRARRRTYAPKRKVRRTRKSKLITKPFIDGLMSEGGKVVIRKVIGANPIYEAGLDLGLGYFRHNKTLMAQGIVKGVTAFLPNLNILGGQGQEPWVGQ